MRVTLKHAKVGACFPAVHSRSKLFAGSDILNTANYCTSVIGFQLDALILLEWLQIYSVTIDL